MKGFNKRKNSNASTSAKNISSLQSDSFNKRKITSLDISQLPDSNTTGCEKIFPRTKSAPVQWIAHPSYVSGEKNPHKTLRT